MARSRSFSIFLLKAEYTPDTALKEEHDLDEAAAGALPDGAVLFVLDNEPYAPWWRGYFKIRRRIDQVTKGALVFVPVTDRWFALSFGHVAHNLKAESYEYDFGLRVTLNSVDPSALKSTDALEPGIGRRQRTQVPIGSDLTLFDFDHDSSILRRLTGKVKPEYAHLFRHATGASNLRIGTKVGPEQLVELCRDLLRLYDSNEYQQTFPDIQNVAPVKDPDLIEKLDDKLLMALRAGEGPDLIVPDMVDYDRSAMYGFSGLGKSLEYYDLFLDRYYDYLENHDFARNRIGLPDLKKHKLLVTDEDGIVLDRHSIYRSLVFDTRLGRAPNVYHLSEGNWYQVEVDFITQLHDDLDALYENAWLPSFNHADEATASNAGKVRSPVTAHRC
jgi:uncharacterized protein (TIGR04141 family)